MTQILDMNFPVTKSVVQSRTFYSATEWNSALKLPLVTLIKPPLCTASPLPRCLVWSVDQAPFPLLLLPLYKCGWVRGGLMAWAVCMHIRSPTCLISVSLEVAPTLFICEVLNVLSHSEKSTDGSWLMVQPKLFFALQWCQEKGIW